MRSTAENAEIIGALEYGDPTPEGFKRIGAGCSRVAYLGPDGKVYKQETWRRSNQVEFESAAEILQLDLPIWLYVPDVEIYGNVLVMEYIDGVQMETHYQGEFCTCDGPCIVARQEQLRAMQILDLHTGNWRAIPSGDDWIMALVDVCYAPVIERTEDNAELEDDDRAWSSPEYCDCSACMM